MSNPPNPWTSTAVEYLDDVPRARLEVLEDRTRQILATNDSPDVGFDWSVNPYRGCSHACAYCYARPTHEYLSLGAGTDFDRKIVVKRNAPDLLRRAFDKATWRGERVVFSGVTDCYQALEASLELTRRCLAVCAEYKNPVGIITKSPLVERDLDLLTALTSQADVWVTISIPLWDPEKARAIEPFVVSPARRARTIERLASRGVQVGVNVAPMIPGLGDEDIPAILAAAKIAGAAYAGYVFLRLPGSVKAVFEARLRESMPLRAERILARVREARGGALYDPRFGKRQDGEGVYATSVHALFETTARRLGLRIRAAHGEKAGGEPEVRTTFERPERRGAQLDLL